MSKSKRIAHKIALLKNGKAPGLDGIIGDIQKKRI